MRTSRLVLALGAVLLLAVGRARSANFPAEISPTALSSLRPTLVTANAIAPARFYTGNTPPPYRVLLTQGGVGLQVVQPSSVSQTRLTFVVPRLAAGFYGFAISRQDSGTGLWYETYRSSQRYFKVEPSPQPARVFKGFDLSLPELQSYPWEFIDTTNVVVSGVITATRTMAQHFNDGPTVFDLSALKDFDYDGEGLCGVAFGLDCVLDGSTTYTVRLPFEMVIPVPLVVYQGQPISVAPLSFRFTGGAQESLTATHAYDFSTDHHLFVNAPYDFVAPLDLHLGQKKDRLDVWGSVPTVAGFSVGVGSESDPVHVGIPPFSTGEVHVKEVDARLGGSTSYPTGGPYTVVESGGIRYVRTAETDTGGLWSIDGNAIALLGLIPVPAVSVAAEVLTAAGVELRPGVGVDVNTLDLVSVKTPDLLPFQFAVRADQAVGPWHIDQPLSFTVEGELWTQLVYEAVARIEFDMLMVDPVTLADWELSPIDTFVVRQPQAFTGTFQLKADVEVKTAPVWKTVYAPDVSGTVAVANYTPAQAAAEQARLASLLPQAPTPVDTIETQAAGTFPPKPGVDFVLMTRATPSGKGAVALDPAPVDGGYAAGTVVTLRAVPASGYAFAGWSGDAAGTGDTTTLKMDGFRTAYAAFVPAASLRTALAHGVLTLSWDPAVTGYVLERTDTLSPGVGWTPVPVAGGNRVDVPTDEGARFYRLRYAP